MRNLSKRATRGAFTLVELLVVVVLIAVLASIAIPKFMNSGLRSREAALRADLKLYRNAVELFTNDCGASPATLADLTATTAPVSGLDPAAGVKTINAADWNGPYLYALVPDPISTTAFDYSVTAGSVGVVTSSAGAPYSGW